MATENFINSLVPAWIAGFVNVCARGQQGFYVLVPIDYATFVAVERWVSVE